MGPAKSNQSGFLARGGLIELRLLLSSAAFHMALELLIAKVSRSTA